MNETQAAPNVEVFHCRWDMGDGEVCGDPATSTVVVRTPSTRARVPLCPHHKAIHNQQAAELRSRRH